MRSMSRNILLLGCALAMSGCEMEDGAFVEAQEGPLAIVGGTETNHEIWRSVVALKMTAANGTSLGTCSGSLIHPEVVITAGHCVKMKASFGSTGYDMTKTPERLEVRAGAKIGVLGKLGEVLSVASAVVYHPDWSGEIEQKSPQDWLGPTPTKDFVDVALVRLATPVTKYGTYCVRSESEPEDMDPGIIVGYGLLGSSKQLSSGVHRWGETTLRKVHSDLTKNYIEIGDPTNTCQGDSGGPLFTEIDGRWEVTAVTSHGQSGICLPKQKAFSTNVVRQYDWIAEQVQDWTGDELGNCTLFGPEDGALPVDTGTEGDTDEESTDEPQSTDSEAEEDTSTEESTDENEEDDNSEAVEDDEGLSSAGGCGCRVASHRSRGTLLQLLLSL